MFLVFLFCKSQRTTPRMHITMSRSLLFSHLILASDSPTYLLRTSKTRSQVKSELVGRPHFDLNNEGCQPEENEKMEKWKNGKMEKWENGKMEKWKNGKWNKVFNERGKTQFSYWINNSYSCNTSWSRVSISHYIRYFTWSTDNLRFPCV